MTRTFAINDNNDIYVGSDGNLVFLSGIEAVMDACKTAAQTQLKECILQQGVGLPNFDAIFNGTPNFALYESYLRSTLLAVPGVTAVAPVQIQVNNHTMTYTAIITTSYGTEAILLSGALNG